MYQVLLLGGIFLSRRKADFLDFCFSKDKVGHSKHMVVCLRAAVMLLDTSSVPVAISNKVSPQMNTHN